MSQVVSKSLASAGDDRQTDQFKSKSKLAGSRRHEIERKSAWKRFAAMTFHGAAATTYGYAICWQNVSEASRLLYLRSNPFVRIYGRWRFLTYNCLVLQFVAYSLCLTAHFIPKLRRSRDFLFTTLAFPVGILVVTTFWGVWFGMGRELISPISLEPFYPLWLNHVTHTIIAPINLIELLFFKKEYSSDKRAITTLSCYTLAYTSYLLYIRWQTGRFVYPFLNQLPNTGVGIFIVGVTVMVVCIYKLGKLVHNLAHGIKTVKARICDGTKKKH